MGAGNRNSMQVLKNNPILSHRMFKIWWSIILGMILLLFCTIIKVNEHLDAPRNIEIIREYFEHHALVLTFTQTKGDSFALLQKQNVLMFVFVSSL